MTNPHYNSEISSCVNMLKENGFIIFPGETGWNIGCSIIDKKGISTLQSQEQFTGAAILLDDSGKLQKYVTDIPEPLWDLVEFSTRPMTVLLTTVVNIAAELYNERGEVAFRIVKDEFSIQLLQRFRNPVLSCTLPPGLKPATGGNCRILNTPAYMVNLRAGSTSDPGVLLRMTPGGRIEFIRK